MNVKKRSVPKKTYTSEEEVQLTSDEEPEPIVLTDEEADYQEDEEGYEEYPENEGYDQEYEPEEDEQEYEEQ